MKLNIWNIFLGFIIICLVLQIHSDIRTYQKLKIKTAKLKINFSAETEKQAELKNLIAKLDDKKYVEELARKKLNLVKKGETAYKICR